LPPAASRQDGGGAGTATGGEAAGARGWVSREGSPLRLGATWVPAEQAYDFALYSKHAGSVTLLLYGADDPATPVLSLPLDWLRHKSGRVWHARVPWREMRGARYYAYAVDGPPPEGRFAWHAFDPDKVLLDPHAASVFFPPAFDREAARRPGRNEGKAPLGYLCSREWAFDWSGESRPRHEADAVIYELHVRGFTRNPNSGVPANRRGTYSGVVDKIPYLRELGVTVVELMPVFQYDPQEGSVWGYMPLSFFAPHHGYATRPAHCEQHDEFRAMVKALHAAGLEVVLDVAYNHTAEGDRTGPTYSYRGIDNSTYYLMSGDPAEPYVNLSGTGNTIHSANRHVRRMVLDSLRHWVEEMHVDGFRFDLASIFTRGRDGAIDPDDPLLLADITSDPHLAGARLIAEPWDAGASLLGRSFPGVLWAQWNGRFRDDVRRFVRGDPGMVGSLMTRLYGSDDLFPGDRVQACHPWQSVNYVTSHDGFTLYDLVAYNERRNRANGHGNADGPAENFSWNCGWEGDEGAPEEVAALRKRQAKNLVCLLLLANGTPMVRAGDEFLQTQGGNSNPYKQDDGTTWLDWERLERNRDLFRFVQRMIAFRKAHSSLARSRFSRDDVRWHGAGPEPDLSPQSRELAFFLRGATEGDRDLYVMINASAQDRKFDVQEPGSGWSRVVDTALESPEDIVDPGLEKDLVGSGYPVRGRSVVVLTGRT
jgi:glycogen operon protein